MRHKWEHETLSQKKEDMRLHQQCWPKCSVLPAPWCKLSVLPLCLLFIFLYCPSPVTGQMKNESVEGRTGRVVFTYSRGTLDGLKIFAKSNSNYFGVPFFSISSSERRWRARCVSKPCPIHLFSKRESKAWIKTEALWKTRCFFSEHCGKAKKTTQIQECLNTESKDKCQIFTVTFGTVAERLSQYKLLGLFASLNNEIHCICTYTQIKNVNRIKHPL